MSDINAFIAIMIALCAGMAIAILSGVADYHNLSKSGWHCTDSVLVGEKHNQRSECVQYGVKNER